QTEGSIRGCMLESLQKEQLFQLKRKGFSDSRSATLLVEKEEKVRQHRHRLGIFPVYKRVDTCAAEFATATAYLYSTYEDECEAEPSEREKIMVLGGGPNRIGQGIEFDYCCVHAALALREDGYETIMVNCNPETVSTDFDTSDRLYFEPLTLEDVLEIVRKEQPTGVIVQFGGQTPLKLARALEAAGVPIIGTSPDSIDLAEDRSRFQQLLQRIKLRQPPNRTASSTAEAVLRAAEIGYPLVVRPSYVLGGRAMDIVHSEEELNRYMQVAMQVSNDSPVLLDRFLDHAKEIDVDAICDGEDVLIGGIMEHIEQAGVHSGDSACSIPPYSLSLVVQDELRRQMRLMAFELGVIGLMNAQFAIRGDEVYVLEVNPRASRTVPFVSKATGVPLAAIAAKVMAGKSLKKQNYLKEIIPNFFAIKEAVFPFMKFPGVDPILGPEMRSTGEVMGIGWSFGGARAKSMKAASYGLPKVGKAFLSVRDADKLLLLPIARELIGRGFELVATRGTSEFLATQSVKCETVNKVMEGRPHIVDLIKNNEINFIVNTTEGRQAISDSFSIRREALQRKVSYSTTIAGGQATLRALDHEEDYTVQSLQQLHRGLDA
ncbi:MAG: carbamoyl-phosphate synthase large subunit, partial [Xanthomonadales bacterium]|nr:carbamoyl-phosphate synthase large subunit [Xanthomonadales bacterium]